MTFSPGWRLAKGKPGFNVILVYDISRWGRFTNADEAAHYEFLCADAGIPLHYCAELFQQSCGLPTACLAGPVASDRHPVDPTLSEENGGMNGSEGSCDRRGWDSLEDSCDGQQTPRKVASGRKMTARRMCNWARKAASDWPYDVAAIGYPGPVVHGRPMREPYNLGKGAGIEQREILPHLQYAWVPLLESSPTRIQVQRESLRSTGDR